jgi:exopolysaccharide biosynthesis polyprenyl glycosylphosphotransferase
MIADFSVVFLTYLGSYWLYTTVLAKDAILSFTDYLYLAISASILFVLIADRVGLYRRESSLLNIKELRGIFQTGIYTAAVILSVSFYVRSISLSRLTLTLAMSLTPVLVFLQRQIFYQAHVRLHQKGFAQKRVFVFGAGDIGRQLAKRLFESPALGLFPAAFLDDEKEKYGQRIRWSGIGPRRGVQVAGGEELLREHKAYGVGLVLIALPSASFERNQRLVEICVAEGLDYYIVPNAYEKFIQNVELFELGGIPILRRRIRGVSLYYTLIKRLVDFTLATFFLLVLSPFITLFAIAIKIDSSGPIIFKQKRTGYRGREFSFYKFRSMYVDAPRYARTPSDPADPRITKVGRWLRRTSLDELPQLFNVWRGDMSLVGPRPEMPFIVSTYTPLQRQRLEAKPGITGVWQISAYRGEPIHANIEYDLFYLENRSFLFDMAIIVKTIFSVIRGVGAV